MNISRVRDYIIESVEKGLPWLVERHLRVTDTKRRIVSIIGPRRSGKTYYIYQLMKDKKEESLYLNFEDTRLIDLDFREMRELINIYREVTGREPSHLFFDEVQNIAGWETALREILDMNRYRIFITGSSSKLLSREIATSLRGRTITFTLMPFSFSEFLSVRGISLERLSKEKESVIRSTLREYLEYGGFPEVVLEEEKDRILKEYYDLILFKDIVERHNLRNIGLTRFLLGHFTQNFSKETSINKILNFFRSQGKRFGKNTLYDYVERIQDSVVLFFLNRYSEKVYQRESWPKKVYLCDSGLSRVIRFSPDTGKLMENTVFVELLRRKNRHPLSEVYYFHTPDGREVDFLVKEAQKVVSLLQVCYDPMEPDIRLRELRSLVYTSEQTGCKDLEVITWDYEAEETFKDKRIRFLPLWKWLLKEE
jgi:hypothetical protein